MAGQIGTGGYIPSTTSPGTADLDGTANAVLALASAGVGTAEADSALAYLAGARRAPTSRCRAVDGPGQLALLILDAHALGVPPTSFGGTDLVARLVATQRTTGSDAGLFGSQDPSFDGAYRQGLSLAALAAVGSTSGTTVSRAESWLSAQQCSRRRVDELRLHVQPLQRQARRLRGTGHQFDGAGRRGPRGRSMRSAHRPPPRRSTS